MLIVNLIGGLGNQMFQYAFGRALSIKRQIPVKYDISELLDRTPKANFTFRDYELDIFEAIVNIADKKEVALYKHQATSLLDRVQYKVERVFKKVEVFNEKAHFIYDAEIYNTSNYTYYNGYWQNEYYLRDSEDSIRKDFAFKSELKGQNLAIAKQIRSNNTIAVHVRRGDYVSNTVSNQVHGTCTPEYYQQAVKLISNQLTNPLLVVFSDEPQWVKDNLAFGLPAIHVSHNQGKDSFEDLRLMSLCQHNIIANSSFSWWGAWLNANPTKVVIAPRQWMQNELVNSSRLTPPSWIRL